MILEFHRKDWLQRAHRGNYLEVLTRRQWHVVVLRFEARPSAFTRFTFSKPHPPFQNSEGCLCNISCTGGASGRIVASAEGLRTHSLRGGACGRCFTSFHCLKDLPTSFTKFPNRLKKFTTLASILCMLIPKAFFTCKVCLRDILEIISNMDFF